MPAAPQQVPTVSLSVDGRALTAPAGASVSAALMAQGIRSWRTTRRHGRPRGQFCGIGACWDCLVSIDGAPVQRACLVQVREGMRVVTSDPALAATPGPAAPPGPTDPTDSTGAQA